MLRNIDLKRLKLFKQVADCGGLTAAETALNINLPAISAHLAALETSLGLRLCERGRKGFRLTSEGQVVLAACNRLLTSLEDFHSEVSAVNNKVSGHLRIGIVDNTTTDKNCDIVNALEKLRANSRDLEINIDIDKPFELERAVIDEKLDIAIGPFHITHPAIDQFALYQERVSLFAGATHAIFGSGQPVELSSLVGLDYVTRGYLRESQVVEQHVSLNSCASAQSLEGIAMLLLTGNYLGYLPDHYALSATFNGALRAVMPEIFSYDTEFKAITRRNKPHSRAVAALLVLLIKKTETNTGCP